jgi:hypothetical protein
VLTDFLKPNVRKIKLISPVAPIKKYVNTHFTNLDLNTTARKEIKKLIHLTSYLDLGSYLVVTFELAHEIGGFTAEIPVEEEVDEESVSPTPRKKGKKKGKRGKKGKKSKEPS